jgi:hypothetical protein
MDDQNQSSPSPADDARTMSPLRQSDYEAIESAVMETAKGRWFLAEFARRNRAADTEAVLAAVARLERLIRRERQNERPGETERMHLDLAEIRDVINRNTSGIDLTATEAPLSEPSVRDGDDDGVAAGDVEGDLPTIAGDIDDAAIQPITGQGPATPGEVVDAAGPAPVPEATDSASTVEEPPSPLRSDPPAAFIETPVPEDLADEQADEAGDLSDESDALARANAAMDDAIETLRGVSGAVAGPPPDGLPDFRIDPIAALPRAERLALFS